MCVWIELEPRELNLRTSYLREIREREGGGGRRNIVKMRGGDIYTRGGEYNKSIKRSTRKLLTNCHLNKPDL
jgi:hypothetical protein